MTTTMTTSHSCTHFDSVYAQVCRFTWMAWHLDQSSTASPECSVSTTRTSAVGKHIVARRYCCSEFRTSTRDLGDPLTLPGMLSRKASFSQALSMCHCEGTLLMDSSSRIFETGASLGPPETPQIAGFLKKRKNWGVFHSSKKLGFAMQLHNFPDFHSYTFTVLQFLHISTFTDFHFYSFTVLQFYSSTDVRLHRFQLRTHPELCGLKL